MQRTFIVLVALFVVATLTQAAEEDASVSSLGDGTIGNSEFGLPKEIIDIDVSEILAKTNLVNLKTIRARFFPDEGDGLVYLKKKASSTSWYGEVENATGMANFNVINGRLTGSATHNDTVYQLSTKPAAGDAPSLTSITRLVLASFPLDEEPKCMGECFDDGEELDVPTVSSDASTYDTIDSMIVYTYEAMCAEASQPYPCDITPENKAPIEDLAALAAEEANSAYELSGVLGRQRLVHVAMVDETYEESNFNQMLNDLSNTTDGLIDEVHEWRDTYAADLVSMFVNNGESCGLAWLFNRKPTAGFSVVCRDCATGYYSYPHEQGHNTGTHHDSANANDQGGAYFSFGYQNERAKIRTIMAYDCIQRSCLRIQRFSSPNITFNGITLGTEETDNVRKLNLRWNEVAAFRNATNTGGGEAPTSGAFSFDNVVLLSTSAAILLWTCSL